MSCNNTPAVHSSKITDNQRTQEASKKIKNTKNQKLSSLLYELAISPNPDLFAVKHNILLDNHRVRVYILWESSASEPVRKKLLKAYNITVEKWSDDMLRCLSPVDQLIPLSEEPAVQSIRLPDKLIKTRKPIP